MSFFTAQLGALPVFPLPCRANSTCQRLADLPVPPAATRSRSPNTFADFLRELPLLPPGSPVRLYSGQLKNNQEAHYRVIDMDAGQGDLQQCADALMRIRAEFLFRNQRKTDIQFNLTSGVPVSYNKWLKRRPLIRNNRLLWGKANALADSHAELLRYLTFIYTYAGTASLDQQLERINGLAELKIGDIFSQPGFPGHAIMVIDMAETRAGQKYILLGQSFMPAQEFHVLKNPGESSPWYSIKRIELQQKLSTPEWDFSKIRLRRWKEQ